MAAVLFLAVGCATVEPVVYRGRVVRKEVVRTVHQPSFACSLARSPDSQPHFAVTRHDLVTYHEVPIHEKVLEYKAPDETNRGNIDHKIVPGEFLRGTPTVRNEKVELGGWGNAEFGLNGVPVKTDKSGVFADQTECVLAMFDDLSRPDASVAVSHAEYGQIVLKVTRDELLASLGVDTESRRRPDRDGLSLTVSCPDVVARGAPFQITLRAKNTGERYACAVTGRTVSRHKWLDGRNFYIGAIGPGEERSFSRTFVAPDDQPGGAVFCAMGVWDVLGALPDKMAPMKLSVK